MTNLRDEKQGIYMAILFQIVNLAPTIIAFYNFITKLLKFISYKTENSTHFRYVIAYFMF